eukprot:6416101-Prymnesium_polylepis.1
MNKLAHDVMSRLASEIQSVRTVTLHNHARLAESQGDVAALHAEVGALRAGLAHDVQALRSEVALLRAS